jgi:hypothetical protein
VTQTSAQRKLTRGIEHIETLREEIAEFEDGDAYVFSTEREPRSAQEIFHRCFATEIKPPPDHWPLLVGEAIQNLRSALDHAVYALAPKRQRNRTQYPIFTDECEFQVIGSTLLPGVPPAIRALIQESQPYRCLPQAPDLDSLEILRTLSNIDKHRELTALAVAIEFESIGTFAEVSVKEWRNATGKPLGAGKAEISSFLGVAEPGLSLDEMQMHPSFAYQVRIEGRPFDTLIPIAQRVYRAITECETGQPLSPLAAYPIYPSIGGHRRPRPA